MHETSCFRNRIQSMLEFHANLVIKLVFPTLWSPSNTILLRFNGGDEKSAVTGVDATLIVVSLVRISYREVNRDGIRSKWTRMIQCGSLRVVCRSVVKVEVSAGDAVPDWKLPRHACP